MNFDSLVAWATGIVLAAAITGHIDELQMWVWKNEAKLLYESRSSTWGSPHFFPNDRRRAPAAPAQFKNQISKTATDRKIHFTSQSN